MLGWYGTETLGDRAILLGLSKIFNKTFGKCTIYLGSIYPFLSERSCLEDEGFYRMISPEVDIEIFDVKERSGLNSVIKKCELVVMGGGPVMDLAELGIIEYGFGYAKKMRSKTALMGCGVGPLFNPKYRKISAHILALSDLVVLRDVISRETAKNLLYEHNYNEEIKNKTINVLHDPAIIPIENFKKHEAPKRNTLAVNLREFPTIVSKDGKNVDDEMFVSLLKCAAGVFDEVRLVPMHTFTIGGDDRYYLSQIEQRVAKDNITVIHKPMPVYDLFNEYFSAECCIGMRYHSVVFQTFLNGKNGVLDYTEPNTGKISGFLATLNKSDSYKSIYVNIQEAAPDPQVFISNLRKQSRVEPGEALFSDTLNEYEEVLKKLMM